MEKYKSRSKGAWPASRDLLLKVWDPLRISEMGKDRNVKFCVRIERQIWCAD